MFDVWDSQENFDAFGETLVPILGELGVELPTPQIAEVYNIIEGCSRPRAQASPRTFQYEMSTLPAAIASRLAMPSRPSLP